MVWLTGPQGCTAANNSNTAFYVSGGNVSGNVLNNNASGIYLLQGTISGNMVINATAGSGFGIYCVNIGSIIGNTVICNTGQSGITSPNVAPVLVD